MSSALLTQHHGVGLRVPHYQQFLKDGFPLCLAEAISENFMGRGGRPRAVLERVRQSAELALHGVSLSIGGVDALNCEYLRALRQLAEETDALSISDHLCFGGFGGHYAHDLWPLPYTEEALDHVVRRVVEVQERLGRRILLENVSSYVEYRASTLSEDEFLAQVAELSDCLILLDVNNVYVSARNHGFDASDYLARLPLERVAQLHLAGHHDTGRFLLDDHGRAVNDAVWQLYGEVVRRLGPVPAIIEWDEQVPALDELLAEAEKASRIEQQALAERGS